MNASLIVIGTGSSAKCSTCTGKWTIAPVSATACSCQGTGLVYSTTTNSCSCAKNAILLYSFSCFQCNGTSATNYECQCPAGSIWNQLILACQKCSAIGNVNNSRAGTNLACQCNNGFIWDVMSLTCISNSSCTGSSCMNCNVVGLTTNGSAAVLLVSNQAKSLPITPAIINSMNQTWTNYKKISGFMCPCASGSTWDFSRLRCYDNNLF